MKKWLLIFLLLCAVPAANTFSQGCVTCTRTAENLDNKSARGLNGGIVYLALLPLSILGILGYFWWRQQRVV